MRASPNGPRKSLPALISLLGSAGIALAAWAAIAAFALVGCIADDKSAGVDEFPNSIYARVDGFLEEGKKSEDIAVVPAISDSLAAGGFQVVAAKRAGLKLAAGSAQGGSLAALAKASAAPACTSGTLSVTLAPVVEPTKRTDATVIVCTDAKFFDAIKDNETLLRLRSVTTWTSGRIDTAEIADGDGDGIINPVAGHKSKSSIVLTTEEKGIKEKTVLTVGPGPDNDFDTEPDNLVYIGTWSKTRGTDTLGSAAYADADGDSVAVDNGKASLVDLVFYQKGPSEDHPEAVWSRAWLRMTVKYKVEAKEVRRARFEMEDGEGRVSMGEVLGRDGGPDIDMRDTVIARFVTVGKASGDSLDTLDVRLTMKLGADFDDKADDSVYAIKAVSRLKLGEESAATFSFVSARPIPSGKDPEDGTLSMVLEYRDGSSLSVEGRITAKVLDVIVTDRDGKRAHVVWDREGRGISYERLK